MRGARSGEDAHFALTIHADRVVGAGHGKDLVEMIALDPVLKFARRVAAVVADFKHGDDDDFDGDWLCCLCEAAKGYGSRAEEKRKNAVDH